MGGHGGGGHARMPAQGGACAHLRCDRRANRVTHMCGAPIVLNMLVHAPARGEAPAALAHQGGDRGCCSARHRDRAYGGDGLRGAASLRHHRELWPLDLLSAAARVAGPADGGALRADGAPGRTQPAHRADGGRRPQNAGTAAARRCRHGRDRARRQHADEGLPQERGGDRGGFRRRTVSLRRPCGVARRRQHRGQGPLQGHHHLGGREHLLAGSGGDAVPASAGDGGSRGGTPGCQMGREPVRVRHAETRQRPRHARGHHRLLPSQHGALQGAEDYCFWATAQDFHGQDPEVRAAGAGPRAGCTQTCGGADRRRDFCVFPLGGPLRRPGPSRPP